MKSYKVFRISKKEEDTEKRLNELAKSGWKVVCSYSIDNLWLILEKD